LTEVAESTGLTVEQVRKEYLGKLELDEDTQQALYLRQRALHVYTESRRVEEFKAICESTASSAEEAKSQLERLGKLMNESHYSCRDLFACSCSELDQLTSLCRSSPPSYSISTFSFINLVAASS